MKRVIIILGCILVPTFASASWFGPPNEVEAIAETVFQAVKETDSSTLSTILKHEVDSVLIRKITSASNNMLKQKSFSDLDVQYKLTSRVYKGNGIQINTYNVYSAFIPTLNFDTECLICKDPGVKAYVTCKVSKLRIAEEF